MYVFVREDLSQAQRVVQATHAVYELMKSGGVFPEECPASIVISVKDKEELESVKDYLDSLFEEYGVDYGCFYEQDMNDELTSIATYPIRDEYKKLFRKYKLLK